MRTENNTNTTMPRIVVPESIDAPMPELIKAANGVEIYTLNCCDQDVVRVSLVFKAGTSLQSVPFSASAAANMLSEGSQRHSAYEIAELLDYYGSYYDVGLDRDYVVLTFVSLSKHFAKTMDIAREIVLEPDFSEHELELYRTKRKHRLAVERSKIPHIARELFGKALFGENHPYGEAFSENFYDSLRREDLIDIYRSRYTAENCIVVCSGKIEDSEKQLINALVADIPQGGDTTGAELPAPFKQKFAFSGKEGAVQSAIRTGRILFSRMHPDFVPMQVVSTILGGYFGSRLVKNLREKRGYTYGIFSGMVTLQHSGYVGITTEVATEVTEDAIVQIFHEMDRLRQESVSVEELNMVRNIMIGETMRILDGPFGIADVTIENIQNGTTNQYLNHFLDTIRNIEPGHVLEISQKYLNPSDYTTVVVGHPDLEKTLEYFR